VQLPLAVVGQVELLENLYSERLGENIPHDQSDCTPPPQITSTRVAISSRGAGADQ
jgi:hypothetical protein